MRPLSPTLIVFLPLCHQIKNISYFQIKFDLNREKRAFRPIEDCLANQLYKGNQICGIDQFEWFGLKRQTVNFRCLIYFLILLKTQVISTSPSDSRTIQQHGADRIELVSALQIGGITPPAALLRRSLEASHLKTMVMVRHQNQGFILEQWEKKLLIEEAVSLVELGCKGIVFGAITQNRKIDEELITLMSNEVSFNKIDITFHKASDYTQNLQQAYETLDKYNIKRVLTQGGTKKVQQNVGTLKQLISKQQVKTLIGGGIAFNNIEWLIKQVNPSEVHIGTCVRKDKYGPVQGELIEKFIEKMSNV